jgi:ribonuclease HII
LPKDDSFKHSQIKDSKKFSSEKKIRDVSDYIKEHATAWTIQYIESDTIDTINIRQAVLKAMKQCCADLIQTISKKYPDTDVFKDIFIMVDGNDFPPYSIYNDLNETLEEIPSQTFEGGDNTYTAIGAASILAKVARDDYIKELCTKHPSLVEQYHIDKNKGYGTAIHLEGIRQYGITPWHRRSYGLCKTSPPNPAFEFDK